MENSKLERPSPLFCFSPFLTLGFVSDFEIRISDFSARDVRLLGCGSAALRPFSPLVLTEFEGLTQKEMAERLGISLSGAKSRVQRGRQQLKQMLLERCEFEFDRLGRIIDCKPRTKEACQECA